MDPALFAIGLLVVALALLALVLLRRLDRLSARLDGLSRNEELVHRLDALTEQVEQRRVGERLQGKLTEVIEGMARLSTAVAELQQHRHESADVSSWSDDLGGVASQHLNESGFCDVHILTDRGELEGLSGKVSFEARRAGVMEKGWLLVEDGVVVDEHIRSAYSAFP